MNWPAQSPDLIPIENLWSIIKSQIAKFLPENKTELKERIVQIWNGIPKSLCEKLALSLKKGQRLFSRLKEAKLIIK